MSERETGGGRRGCVPRVLAVVGVALVLVLVFALVGGVFLAESGAVERLTQGWGEIGGGSSPAAPASKSKFTYDASQYPITEWSYEQYPDYVRVEQGAQVCAAVKKGAVEYVGADVLGRTGPVAAIVTSAMVEASAGWRESFDDTANDVSGWGHNAKVRIDLGNGDVYSGYFWNRSHLLADSLGGKASKDNLITGTRTQNVGRNDGNGGMAYTEALARNWLKSHPDGTLYYSAIPVYQGQELVPRSVYVDMRSSDGTLDLHVEVFNAARGYVINYADGTFSAA